jgi:hypothetical protein
VRILHDLQKARIVIASDPAEPDRARLDGCHDESPSVVGTATVDRVGEGG